MSIADKITSIENHLTEDYKAISNMGIDLTNVDKNIENIAECVNQIYDNAPKTLFQTGTEVTLENCLKGKLDFDNGVVGIGQASQESTTGKNLLNNVLATQTLNGITATRNNDGSVTLNGTATAQTDFNLISSQLNLDSATYTVSISSTGQSNVFIQWGVSGVGIFGNHSATKDVTTTFPYTAGGDSYSYINMCRVRIASGVTCSNYKIYPQIEKNSSATTYEKYTGGYSSPSPNWKQDVKCVAGRNKFDIGTSLSDYFQTNTNGTRPGSWTVNTATATIVGNKLTIDSYNTSGWNWISKWVELQPNTDYIISGTNTSVLKIVGFNSNELQSEGTLIAQKTSSESTKIFNSGNYKYYCLSMFPEATGKYFENIQVEEGTQATSYLPYNTIKETIRGKNLYSGEVELGAINGSNGQPEANSTVVRTPNYINVQQVRKIAIVGNDNVSRVKVLCTYNSSKQYLGNSTISNNNVFDIDTITISNQSIYYHSNSEIAYIKFVVTGTTDTSILYGVIDNSTTYELYKTPKTYQFSLGNNKFYSIGNYADELIYDVDEDKVYKNEKIGEVALKSTLGWIQAPSSVAEGTTRFYCNKSDVANLQAIQTKDVLSNGFIPLTWNEIYIGDTTTKNAISDYSQLDSVANRIVLRIDNNYASSVNELNTFLDNNNFYACYVKTEPTLIEITDTTLKAQVKAWYNAHSNNGTTIITSNGNLPMIIKCRALKGE